ncbi:MAG: hypothetical protein QE570_10260 [Verrucomicrobiota bacterium]|nr:hypothetical protein [Verrucomicrobiota bacterium]
MKYILLLTLFCLSLSQCNSVKVSVITPNPPVKRLAIVRNDKTFMSEMEPEIVKQVKAMGIVTELVDAPPLDNSYYMTYTANWSWDLAMYLRYFQASLHQGPILVNSVDYKTSGLDLNKFGHTDNKIRPLLHQLILGEKLVRRK